MNLSFTVLFLLTIIPVCFMAWLWDKHQGWAIGIILGAPVLIYLLEAIF